MSVHFREMSQANRLKYGFTEPGAREGPPHTMVDGSQATYLLSPEKGLIVVVQVSSGDEVWRGPIGLRSYQIVVEMASHTSREYLKNVGMVKDESTKPKEETSRFE